VTNRNQPPANDADHALVGVDRQRHQLWLVFGLGE